MLVSRLQQPILIHPRRTVVAHCHHASGLVVSQVDDVGIGRYKQGHARVAMGHKKGLFRVRQTRDLLEYRLMRHHHNVVVKDTKPLEDRAHGR